MLYLRQASVFYISARISQSELFTGGLLFCCFLSSFRFVFFFYLFILFVHILAGIWDRALQGCHLRFVPAGDRMNGSYACEVDNLHQSVLKMLSLGTGWPGFLFAYGRFVKNLERRQIFYSGAERPVGL